MWAWPYYCHSNYYNFIGSWIQGHKCPHNNIGTHFQGQNGYNLDLAKSTCQAACDARDDCFFADLYYETHSQTCYLRGSGCGDWQSTMHGAYQLYIKGIYQDLGVERKIHQREFFARYVEDW